MPRVSEIEEDGGDGGAIGAAARYLVNITCAAFLPPTFPFATFGITAAA